MNQMDGGSAFPQIESSQVGERGEYHTEVSSYGGMTLRDYFAAKALQGFIANVGFRYATESETAEQVYKLADAMLKAREA